MSLDSLNDSRRRILEVSGDAGKGKPDLVCFSHLRWDWVFQRPQHLMTRCARDRRVFFFEEPVFDARTEAKLEVRPVDSGVAVATPHLPAGLSEEANYRAQRALVDHLLEGWSIDRYVSWYYSPLFLPVTSHLRPALAVYDCMDELAAFAGAHPALLSREAELLSRADLVYTGGMSLYEAKKHRHPKVHAFPSSIDKAHFAAARIRGADPEDQAGIPGPRIGFHGVVDERFDYDLLAAAADLRPGWSFVVIGPFCKVDPAAVPRRPNIHFLGKKDYAELPRYLAGWDMAMMPFARNEATRYISPTKTPEYLAAGKPVVSTSISDVVDPYGNRGLVHIADTPEDFVAACGRGLAQAGDAAWKARVDEFLSGVSWDRTWADMDALMLAGCAAKGSAARPARANGRLQHV